MKHVLGHWENKNKVTYKWKAAPFEAFSDCLCNFQKEVKRVLQSRRFLWMKVEKNCLIYCCLFLQTEFGTLFFHLLWRYWRNSSGCQEMNRTQVELCSGTYWFFTTTTPIPLGPTSIFPMLWQVWRQYWLFLLSNSDVSAIYSKKPDLLVGKVLT